MAVRLACRNGAVCTVSGRSTAGVAGIVRVKVDSAGLITAVGSSLASPYVSFPIYLTEAELMGLTVITGMGGVRLLVQGGQVIAREEGPSGGPVVTVTDPVTGAVGTYPAGAIDGLDPRTYSASATTNASGAVTFTLPAGYFTTIAGAVPTVVRDTSAPAQAAFAMLRSVTTTGISVQCFESKTTGVLIGGTVEGLEAAGAGLQVLLTVTGW